ncbi:YraN family protein [Candidatus Sumerlaeota bacterium]|nr:YraN family protein [Candidatus Sumerlaeota bacterium]
MKNLLFRKRTSPGHLSPRELGVLGENLACQYLEKENYAILERNFRCFLGEIDIVARENHRIVIVEVKTQYSHVNIPIEWKINGRKKKKLYSLFRFYQHTRLTPGTECRIDVITVIVNSDNSLLELKHYKRAI